MAKKVTKMKLKIVDLQCDKCYKKVKKVLCKFPQIQDQEYDQKNNIVTIRVVCCNPEKIRDKLCCKGCGVIKSIEIVESPEPKPPPTLPPPTPLPLLALIPTPTPPPVCLCPPPPPPVCLCPPAPPSGVCCVPCNEGRAGGPCFHGYYRRPIYDSYGGGRPCYLSLCAEYFCEENTSGCRIM